MGRAMGRAYGQAHGPGPWAGPWAGPMGRAHGPGPGPGRVQAKHVFLAYDINKKDAQRPYDPFAGGIAPRSLLCVSYRGSTRHLNIFILFIGLTLDFLQLRNGLSF